MTKDNIRLIISLILFSITLSQRLNINPTATAAKNIAKPVDAILPPIVQSCIPTLKIYSFSNCLRTQFYLSYSLTFPYNVAGVIWDFGDGTTSNEYYPSHFYPSGGIYLVTLTLIVTTPQGKCCTRKVKVEVKVKGCSPCDLIKLNQIQITDYNPLKEFNPTIPHNTNYLYKWTFHDSTAYTLRTVWKNYPSNTFGWAQLKIIYSDGKTCCEATTKKTFGFIIFDKATDLTANREQTPSTDALPVPDVSKQIEEYTKANPNDELVTSA